MRKLVHIGIMLLLFATIVNTAGCDGDDDYTATIPETGAVEHGCEQAATLPESRPDDFSLLYRYGYGGALGNELNTINGTYTKDLGLDPSVTIDFAVADDDLDRIYNKMLEIEFFCYPEEFVIPAPESGIIVATSNYQSYYFRVVCNDTVKLLQWDDDRLGKHDDDADLLRELIRLLRYIIEHDDAYWELPSPRGVHI